MNLPAKQLRRDSQRQRRGAIFITALGIIVILSAMVLVFARSMRTEAMASANRLSYVQADAIEHGAEQWVLAQAETYPGDAITITRAPAEAIQVGGGYFWLIRPDPDTDQTQDYGIIDEAGKLNLNNITSATMQLLPGMTEDLTDPVQDWRSDPGAGKAEGAESDYYGQLPEGYNCKNAPYESVEEVMLVKNTSSQTWQQILYGFDLNRDGVVDDAERNAAGGATAMFSDASGGSRGIFNFLTVYSAEPNKTIDGDNRVNVNGQNNTQLQTTLTAAMGAAQARVIANGVRQYIRRSGQTRPFRNIGQFYTFASSLGMTADQFGQIADQITATGQMTLKGLINVATAPREVLMCLPNLTQSDADSIISAREGSDTSNIAWVFSAIAPDLAAGIAGRITSRSYVYSADIVAVSGDGRSFKRVRIVVDSQQIPAKIVYRKDLTSLGWPLPQAIHDQLRSGKGLSQTTNGMTRMP